MPKLPWSAILDAILSGVLSLSPAFRLLATRSTALKIMLFTVTALIASPPAGCGRDQKFDFRRHLLYGFVHRVHARMGQFLGRAPRREQLLKLLLVPSQGTRAAIPHATPPQLRKRRFQQDRDGA